MHERESLMNRVKRDLRRTLKKYPLLHRLAKEVLVGSKLIRFKFRRARAAKRQPGAGAWTQPPLRFEGPRPLADLGALREALDDLGLKRAEGRHTIYLPPQDGLEKLLGGLPAAYPDTAGFKLLKHLGTPADAHYLYKTDALWEASLLGPVGNQAMSAVGLATFGLGPRLYDVAHLAAAPSDLTVLVSEHVDGGTPTMEEYRAFIAALEDLRKRGLLTFAHHSEYENFDFKGPGCNGNLVAGSGGALYVDPQTFLFDFEAVVQTLVQRHAEAMHFGDILTVVNRGDVFPYQDIPGSKQVGRRDVASRWDLFESLLAKHGGTVEGAAVFDICCNAGMVTGQALAAGATWATGWDLPQVVAAARDLLPMRGVGRFTLHGQTIGEDAPLEPPPAFVDGRDSVCFFLAAWHHVGFPDAVGDLPWRYLVYEGQENETVERTAENLATMEKNWNAKVRERAVIVDGICQPRPVAVLVR